MYVAPAWLRRGISILDSKEWNKYAICVDKKYEVCRMCPHRSLAYPLTVGMNGAMVDPG